MKTGVCCFFLFSSSLLLAATPKVALLYSDYGNNRHRDDYDKSMTRLDWPLTQFENREIGTLAKRLNEFDILLGSALFNYSNVQPLGKYRAQLLDFVAGGGAVVLTDFNYPQHVDWLRDLGEDWAVELVPQDGKTYPTSWQDHGSLLYREPHPIELGGTWMGLRPGKGWRILAKGKDGAATVLYRSHGKGFFYLSCHWPLREAMLQNIWQGLQTHRRGLVPHLPSLESLSLGRNELLFSARNTAASAQTIGIRIWVTWNAAEHTQHCSRVVEPGKELVLPYVLDNKTRGPYEIRAAYTAGEEEVYSGVALKGQVPELLTTELRHPYPRSKPLLYAEAMPQRLVLLNKLHPGPGQDVKAMQVQLRLLDKQAEVSKTDLHFGVKPEFELVLDIPRPLSPPACIEQRVMVGKQVLQVSELPLEIAPVSRPSVIVDDRLALQVNGKPYFPIGVYHVGIQDLPKARALGFNCFQGWGSDLDIARKNLDAARRNDMMVLLELSSFLRREFRPDDLAKVIEAFKDHPALLTWYSVDEPQGNLQLSWARQAFADIVKRDPYHPVYLVMCSPGSFDRFGATTDILAIDPYPIGRQSVRQVSHWMARAQKAVRGSKPIWMIPQVFNWSAYNRKEKNGRPPTPEELRNMTYQSLVWGAKGVIYFPWDTPDKASGVLHEPKLLGCIGRLNAELAELGSQLLVAVRTTLADGGKQPFVAASFRLQGRTLVLAANLETKACAVSLPVSGNKIASRYGSPKAVFAKGKLQAQLPPLGVAVWEIR